MRNVLVVFVLSFAISSVSAMKVEMMDQSGFSPVLSAINPNIYAPKNDQNQQNQGQQQNQKRNQAVPQKPLYPDSGMFLGYYSDNLFSRYGLDIGLKYRFNSVKMTLYWQGGVFNRKGPDYTDSLNEIRNTYTIQEKSIGLEFMTSYDINLLLIDDFFMGIRCGIGYGWTINSNTFQTVYASSQDDLSVKDKHLRIKATYYYEFADIMYLEIGPVMNIYFEGLRHDMGKPVQWMCVFNSGIIF